MRQQYLATITTALALLATPPILATPLPETPVGQPCTITPHAQFSSSVGVLGCKINIDRVAYFPAYPLCTKYCVRVTANGRSVTLLHIDHSGGAHDISYDAWNYLVTGKSAREDPTYGGGIPGSWEYVENSECDDLIPTEGHKIPLSASTAVIWGLSCAPGTVQFWNIATAQCTLGVDEKCEPPPQGGNQPVCPSQLGTQNPLDLGIVDLPVPIKRT